MSVRRMTWHVTWHMTCELGGKPPPLLTSLYICRYVQTNVVLGII
jgi:hypothetical protein